MFFLNCSPPREGEKSKSSHEIIQSPIDISDEEQSANQFIRHFWDNFNYSDTSMISILQAKINIMSYYVAQLSIATLDSARKAINQTLIDAQVNSALHNYFLQAYKKFFYNPNSSVRNDELYIVVLEHILTHSRISFEKISAETQLKLLKKNRIGTLATDFEVITNRNNKIRLYHLNTDYSLLIFYNPDCNACEQVIRDLKSSLWLTSAIEKKKITIMAVYPESNTQIWKDYQSKMPNVWVNTYDKNQTIAKKSLYSIRATPTLYLLDKEKKVILKDADVKDIERYFSERSMNN